MANLRERIRDFLKHCDRAECNYCEDSEVLPVSVEGFETEKMRIRYTCSFCDTTWLTDTAGKTVK